MCRFNTHGQYAWRLCPRVGADGNGFQLGSWIRRGRAAMAISVTGEDANTNVTGYRLVFKDATGAVVTTEQGGCRW